MLCGIKIDTEQIDLAIISHDGEFVFEQSLKLPADENTLIQLIVQTLSGVDSACQPQALGITFPGFYAGTAAPEHYQLYCASIPALHKTSLKYRLQASLNIPVSLASYGQALCASHLQHYPDKNIFALHVAQDASAGLGVRGHLISGAHGIAGNWGHISLPWPVDYELDNKVCWCGKSGCLAHFVSLGGLEQDYTLLTNEQAQAQDIISRARQGDIVAESVIQVLEDRLARGLAMVCNLFDPDLIILGGYLGSVERIFSAIPRKWPGYSQIGHFSVELAAPAYDDKKSLLIGASQLEHHHRKQPS